MTSPLLDLNVEFPQTSLWVTSASPEETIEAIGWGATGALPSLHDVAVALGADAGLLAARMERIGSLYPRASAAQAGLLLAQDILLDVAAALQPAFARHSGREGRVALPVDPGRLRDPDALLENATELGALATNTLVAIPATQTGIGVMEEASRLGVSVAAVACCSVAQALEAAGAIERGVAQRGTDDGTRPIAPAVCLDARLMSAHLTASLEQSGPLLDPGSSDWGTIAIAKEAYRLFTERAYTARLVVAHPSSRPQVMEMLGGDLALAASCDFQRRLQRGLPPLRERISLPVSPERGGEISRLPQFAQAIEPLGLEPAAFGSYPPVRTALREQLAAGAALTALAADLLYPA